MKREKSSFSFIDGIFSFFYSFWQAFRHVKMEFVINQRLEKRDYERKNDKRVFYIK